MKRRGILTPATLILLVAAAACPPFGNCGEPGEYWPSATEWRAITPAEAGMNGAKVDEALAFAEKNNSDGVVVVRKGKIVAEKYWKGRIETTASDICSAQKSIDAILIGMAIDAGLIKGVEQPAADFLTEWKGTPKEKITVRHLLTMTSGLYSSMKSDLFDALRAKNQTRYALDLELAHEPGTFWTYNNPAYGLVKTVYERASGKGADDFAREKLFTPLGMGNTRIAWHALGERFQLKHHSFECSCKDLARFGLFILRGGKWNGKQLVNTDFLKAATTKSQELNDAYGYLWWLNGGQAYKLPYDDQRKKGMLFPSCPVDTISAMGAKDSRLYIVPSLDLVVVRLGENADSSRAGNRLAGVLGGFDDTFLGMVCKSVRAPDPGCDREGAAETPVNDGKDGSSGKAPEEAPAAKRLRYNAGLRILGFAYEPPGAAKETVWAAVWYPADAEQRKYGYTDFVGPKGTASGEVALDAPFARSAGPCPLVIFAHGGFSCGYGSAFISEHLARNGYIVVAPDYIDTRAPDYREQIAFSRIKEGNAENPLRVLMAARQFVEDMAADRALFLSYLEEHRLRHTTFVIDEALRLNASADSFLHGSVRAGAIGIFGHSEGGLTVLGKIGAHPVKEFKDARIKCALTLSAPVFPFEETLGGVDVPLMALVGDNDSPAVHPELPRRMVFDKVAPPKYYLVLKDGTHFSFGNSVAQGEPLPKAVETNPQARALCAYSLAFFDKYLRGDAESAAVVLDQADPAWAYYVREENKGEQKEWGAEPPASTKKTGYLDGLREHLRKK
ncbi:MAG: serine hydrolase [Planctomycetota bacterium]|nr:serine hydrolase [Planctomycetota bacterium]